MKARDPDRILGASLAMLAVVSLISFPSSTARAASTSPPPACPAPAPGQQPDPGPRECVSIQGLNPSLAPSGAPKVSDRADGVDQSYPLVATVTAPFDGMKVVASLTGPDAHVIGSLDQVQASPDTWSLEWDVPDSVREGSASVVFEVRDGAEGPAIASDQVAVDLQHKDHPPPLVPTPTSTDLPAMETAALTWPEQGGELGFYRPPGGRWATVVSGLLSAGTNSTFTVYYTNTPLGWEPVWTSCGSGTNPPARPEDGIRPFKLQCVLNEGHSPASVTAVAVLPQRSVSTTTGSRVDVGASDAHRVRPFVQTVSEMDVSISGVGPASPSLAWPSGARRTSGSGCLDVEVKVTDRHGQPVQGANVDVELRGPADSVKFGSGASTAQVPTGVTEQDASNCTQGGTAGKQGSVEIAEGPDLKRLESDKGSGLSGGGAGLGAWRFKVFSPQDAWGSTSVTAWVDEEPPGDGSAANTDNELLDPTEPSVTTSLSWLEKSVAITVAPGAVAAPVDSCERYEFSVAGGSVPLANVNVDVMFRGPAPEIRFCDVEGASALRVPDGDGHGTSDPPDGGVHPSNTPACPTTTGPACHHRETETNEAGKVIFGLSADSSGPATVTVWLDGEPGTDDDLNNFTGGSLVTSTSWIGSASDAKLTFTNPSSYAGPKTISDGHFKIVLSTDVPYIVPGADIELVSGTSSVSLGRAESVVGGHTYEFDWDLTNSPLPGAAEPGSVPDGSYTLKARIPETGVIAQATVVVDRVQGAPQDPAPPEGVEIVTPTNGRAVAAEGQTLKVKGIATKGAEGVDLFYSVTPHGQNVTWVATRCGYVDLSGTGTQPQPFEGVCTIAATHVPQQVTAIAAASLDCATVAGCDAGPSAGAPGGRGTGGAVLETGDAVRIDVCAQVPCLKVGPAEAVADVGGCVEVVVQALDATGPIAGAEIAAEATGPADGASFCSSGDVPARASTRSSFEGTTDADGLVTIGVSSNVSSFPSIFSPIETEVTTLEVSLNAETGGEVADRAVFHWLLPGRCTVIGTEGDDELYATSFPDKICGLGGNDTIYGLDGLTGNDLILGGPGDDTIFGNRGDDVILGQSGNDTIFGGHGSDRIRGGAGDDELFGDRDKDDLNGGKGDDGCDGGKQGASTKSCERAAKAPPKGEER